MPALYHASSVPVKRQRQGSAEFPDRIAAEFMGKWDVFEL
jgi:hypothetical protein